MMKRLCAVFTTLLGLAAPVFSQVVVASPADGTTVGTSVPYAATSSTSSCSAGVASMGIYVDNVLMYVSPGSTLQTTLPVSKGAHNTVVEEWDYCGGATYTSRQITVDNQSAVTVTTPANGRTVTSPATYGATATTTCPRGVAAMGIYVNNELVYSTRGSKLNTTLSLSAGAQNTVVEEWDYCGGASYTPINVTVTQGSVLQNLQASSGWVGYGELPPNYSTCSDDCYGINWSASQGISSPSLSGNATKFQIGGSFPYADVLWTIPLIGDNSTQNLPDRRHTLLPSIHNFTYDADVFVTDWDITQVLEFDISMYMNGSGMIWGNQCDHLADHTWDIWDNGKASWVSTGVACNLNNNAWNHISIQMQRQDDNTLIYNSITVNGTTANLNLKYSPFAVPGSWWGVTANYQMDGNYIEAANTTYVDNFNITYW